jgi:hypothetical protein
MTDMARDIFNRFEQKYLISDTQKIALCQLLDEQMQADACNPLGQTYSITNIYCDDRDFSLIRQSLARPEYKEKLRLRSYGVPKPDDLIYLEIKKKYKGKVNKRRTRIQLQDALRLLQTGGRKLPEDNKCDPLVLEEVCSLLKRYNLRPAWYVAYDRLAYAARDSSGLRVSLDRNIRWRSEHLDLTAGDFGRQLIEPDQWLLEIKTPRSIPLWLTEHLSTNHIYPNRFSKYGKSFQLSCREKNNYQGAEIPCSIQYSLPLQAQAQPIASHQHS